MKKLLSILLLLAFTASAPALDIVKAIITITNLPATGNKLVGNASTRTWTNDISSSPSTLVATNTTIGTSATNLYLFLGGLGVFSQSQSLSRSNNNVVALQGAPGEAMVFTATGWGTVTYQTNSITNQTYLVRMPLEVEVSSNRIAIASHIVRGTSLYSTNSFDTNAVALANYSTLTTGQTLSNKTVRASFVQNSQFTNGQIFSTNSYLSNSILHGPVFTNAVNYGDAFSSPGSGTLSEQFGVSASATGGSSLAVGAATSATADNATAINANATADNATAMGILATASGTNSTAIGTVTEASGFNSAAFGYNSLASYEGATALGVNTLAQNTNSTAVGYGAATTANNQVMLGSATVNVRVNNELQIGGSITNATYTGDTNTWNGSRAEPLTRNSALVNGNNADVKLTNIWTQLAGPTANFTNAGFIFGLGNRAGLIVQIENTNGFPMAILNQSGLEAVQANRVITGTGGTLVITNNPGWVQMRYDADVSRWKVQFISN